MTAVLAIALGIAITAAMRFELNAAFWRRAHDRLAVEVEALRCHDLDAFHDGELSAERADAFRLHLGTCERCADVLEGRMHETATTSPARNERR